jgi:catechol 2,3-dioxygenase-like lactoylglutathione lyase family enzyme
MAKLTALRPMLYTSELDATIAFYVSVLGFTLDERMDDLGWASLSRDGVSVMLAKPNAHTLFDKPTFTGSFYFNTDDVETLWANLKSKAKICYDIDTFSYGMREFAIYDNNGYVLQFGQPSAA